MNNYEKIYWLTRLENIKGLGIAIMVIFLVAIIVTIVASGFAMINVYGDNDKKEIAEKTKKWKLKIWLYAPMAFLGLLITTFTPTKNEAILIFAGGTTMDFAESDSSLQKIPHQTTAIISGYFDKALKELSEDVKEGEKKK